MARPACSAVALLIARAVSEGERDYDAPVARWWPDFAAGGKGDITLAEALSHQSGLVGFAEEAPADIWLDWTATTARLAAMAPSFPPRSASGYGPQTFGFVAGEVLRRATGRGVAQMLREDFGDIDLHCALRSDEIARAAYMQKPPRAPELGALTELKRIAFLKPWSAPGNVTRDAWMAAEIPSANMHATARALAELAHPLANGGLHRGRKIVSADALAAMQEERILGDDLVLPFRLSWAAGVMRNINGHFGPGASALGHAGFGGSSVMFDPVHRLSAAYVMNKMSPHLVGDPRGLALVNSVYAAL